MSVFVDKPLPGSLWGDRDRRRQGENPRPLGGLLAELNKFLLARNLLGPVPWPIGPATRRFRREVKEGASRRGRWMKPVATGQMS